MIADEVPVPFVPLPSLKITRNDWSTPHWSLFDVTFGWFDRQHQLPPANHPGHVDRKDRKQIKNQKHSIDITTFVSPVIFSIAFCAAIIADRCEFRIRDSNHAPGKKQFATIFPLTQQLPQQKKTNANPFFLKRHTHTNFFSGIVFSRKLHLSHFLTNVGSGTHHSKSLPAMQHSFSLENHLLRQRQIHGTGIYTGLHECLTLMVNVGTLKATNISIHIPPNGKTKIFKSTSVGNMLFFLGNRVKKNVPGSSHRNPESHDFNF